MKKSSLRRKTPLKAHTALSRVSKVKTSTKKRPAAKSLSKLKREADAVFSRFIRYRDTDSHGYGKCITCDQTIHFKKAHCGHFISRRFNITRYSERNCSLQCYACNVMQHGRQYEYALALDKKYGAGTAQELYLLSKELKQFKREDLLHIIDTYTEKITEFESQYITLA